MEDFVVRFILGLLGVIGFLWLLVICLTWIFNTAQDIREGIDNGSFILVIIVFVCVAVYVLLT
tara:strand:- start:2317 stop:2505 length:189 start_codon:yes stop_codon:yes gene_type:complete